MADYDNSWQFYENCHNRTQLNICYLAYHYGNMAILFKKNYLTVMWKQPCFTSYLI